MDKPDMYYGMDWNPGYAGVFDGEDVLVSAGVAWYSNPGDWFSNLRLPENRGKLFIDSGGFQATARWGVEYPYSIGMYFNYAEQLGADYVAGPDFACEPSLHVSSTQERVLKTAALHTEAARIYKQGEWSFEFVPVLQGWEVGDYRRCIRIFRDAGVLAGHDRVAIGTVCKRKDVDEIHDVLRVCEKRLPEKEYHLFGLTKRAWKDRRFWGRFASADTAAWNWGASTTAEKIEAAREYITEINEIRQDIDPQTTFDEVFVDG